MSGKVVTEGDRLLKADVARESSQVDGTGVKVGIISGGFNTDGKLNEEIANGELPGEGNLAGRNTPVRVLQDLSPENADFGSEGRALAQIIHDMAPGAELLFRTAVDESPENVEINNKSYAEAVDALVAAGADVIVSDAAPSSTILQDDLSAQAAQKATEQGVVFIAAAGNDGSTSYQSKYRSDGTKFDFEGKQFEAFDFDASKNVDLFQDVSATEDGKLTSPLLSWSEASGEVKSNLKMFLMDSPNLPGQGGNILAVSDFPDSSSTADPLQSFIYPTNKDDKFYLAIGRELNDAPAPDFIKWVSTANGFDRTTKYEYINSNDREKGSSTVYGAANAKDVIAVGAVDSQQDFSKTPELQKFTSRGSSPIFFDDEGDPLLNPEKRTKPDIAAIDGDLLLNPQQRSKPDIAGIDNISTTVPGFDRDFKGTSAAAPHIAGVVALMEQAAGGSDVLSPQQITEILQSTSTPLQPTPGLPGDAGLARADLAVNVANNFGQTDAGMYWA
jgi:hypothetical protein